MLAEAITKFTLLHIRLHHLKTTSVYVKEEYHHNAKVKKEPTIMILKRKPSRAHIVRNADVKQLKLTFSFQNTRA